jgi:hypothetical protein
MIRSLPEGVVRQLVALAVLALAATPRPLGASGNGYTVRFSFGWVF